MFFRNISAWSIRNPVPSLVLFAALLLAGLVSFLRMEVQNDPDIDIPIVWISHFAARRGADRDGDPGHPAGRGGGALDRGHRRDQFERQRRQFADLRQARPRHADRPGGQRHSRRDHPDPRRPARRHSRAPGRPRQHLGRRHRQLGGDLDRHDARAAELVRRQYRLEGTALGARPGRGEPHRRRFARDPGHPRSGAAPGLWSSPPARSTCSSAR